MTYKFVLATAAAATMLAATGTALAAPGVTLATVNMREAPGGPIIEALARGTYVEVNGCRRGWCEVEYDGELGYVSAKYLALDTDDGDGDDDDYDDEVVRDRPSVSACVGGGGFGAGGFGFGRLCVGD